MEDKRYSLPKQRNFEYALNQAFELAVKRLAGVTDIERMCRGSGAGYRKSGSQGVITLRFFSRDFDITLPEAAIAPTDSPEEEVPPKTKVLLLHYLTHAKGIPLSNRVITFKELPEGLLYLPTFTKRTLTPLLRYLGDNPHQLLESGLKSGGRVAEFGDAAVTFSAFPRVPVTLVLWQGDSEFPPEAGILFDESITGYLPTEDIIVTCETIIWTLVKSLTP